MDITPPHLFDADDSPSAPSLMFRTAVAALEAGAPHIVLRLLRENALTEQDLHQVDEFGMTLPAIAQMAGIGNFMFNTSWDDMAEHMPTAWRGYEGPGSWVELFSQTGRARITPEFKEVMNGYVFASLLLSGCDPWATWTPDRDLPPNDKIQRPNATHGTQGSLLADAIATNNTHVFGLLLSHPDRPSVEKLTGEEFSIDMHRLPNLSGGKRITDKEAFAPITHMLVSNVENEESEHALLLLQKWLDLGIDTNAVDSSGNTALFYARTPSVVKALLAHGADASHHWNPRSRTAMDAWSHLYTSASVDKPPMLMTMYKVSLKHMQQEDGEVAAQQAARIIHQMLRPQNAENEKPVSITEIRALARFLKKGDKVYEQTSLSGNHSPLTTALLSFPEVRRTRFTHTSEIAKVIKVLGDKKCSDPKNHIIIPGCTDADLAVMMGMSDILDSEVYEGISDEELLVKTLKAACALMALQPYNKDCLTLMRTGMDFVQRCFWLADPPDLPSLEAHIRPLLASEVDADLVTVPETDTDRKVKEILSKIDKKTSSFAEVISNYIKWSPDKELAGLPEKGYAKVVGKRLQKALKSLGLPGTETRDLWDRAVRKAWVAAVVAQGAMSKHWTKSWDNQWPGAPLRGLPPLQNDLLFSFSHMDNVCFDRLKALAKIYPDSEWAALPMLQPVWMFAQEDIEFYRPKESTKMLWDKTKACLDEITEEAGLLNVVGHRHEEFRDALHRIKVFSANYSTLADLVTEENNIGVDVKKTLLKKWNAVVDRAFLALERDNQLKNMEKQTAEEKKESENSAQASNRSPLPRDTARPRRSAKM